MHRRLGYVAALAFLWTCGLDRADAKGRGIPIVILWGRGQEVVPLGSLPTEVEARASEELGPSPQVCFMYDTFRVFWMGLWNWNGQHVLRAGADTYWELDAAQWRELLGDDPQAVFGKPLEYRFPPLLTLAAFALAIWFVRVRLFPTEDERLARLARDPRYQRAMQTWLPNYADGETEPQLPIDEQRFAAARDVLVSEGVPAEVATENLRKLANLIYGLRDRQIASQLAQAEALYAAGQHAAAESMLQELYPTLPSDHPSRASAEALLARMAAEAAESASQDQNAPATA